MRSRTAAIAMAVALAGLPATDLQAQSGLKVIVARSSSSPPVVVDNGRFGEALILQRAQDAAGVIVQPAGTAFDPVFRRPGDDRGPDKAAAHCLDLVEGPCPRAVSATLVGAMPAPEGQNRNRVVGTSLPDRGARPGNSPLSPRAGRAPHPVTWSTETWPTF